MSGLHDLYRHLAPHYSRDVLPFMEPLARGLLAAIPAKLGHYSRALDVGTGTGVLARLLPADQVIGLDLVPEMLAAAPPDQVQYVAGDIQNSPFPDNTFPLIASLFGLSTTVPKKSFRAIWRLLEPGGLFVMDEWGALDPHRDALESAVWADNPRPQATPKMVVAMEKVSHLTAALEPWGAQIQDIDDYQRLLKAARFTEIQVTEVVAPPIPTTREAFIRYHMAWLTQQLLVDAQPNPARSLRAVERALPAAFDWQPFLHRVSARKG